MSIFIVNLLFNLINQSSGYKSPITFTRNTVAEVKMWTRDVDGGFFKVPEERHKICLYAKMEANLAYIAYNYERSWRDWVLQDRTNRFGINCGTLPSMYIVDDIPSDELEITFRESLVNKYKFNTTIITAESVTPRDQRKSNLNQDEHVIDLSDEDRKNLCDAARQKLSVPLYFLDHNVPEVRSYEFKYSDNKEPEEADAISCPTLPQLFIILGHHLKLVLLPSFIDDYKFELENTRPSYVLPGLNIKAGSKSNVVGKSLTQLEPSDRRTLCNIARRDYAIWLSPFVEDTDVPDDARPYVFRYPQGEEIESVAIFCSELPSLYLPEDNSSKKTKIKITFAPNPANRYTYKVEIIYDYNSSWEEDVPEMEETKLKEHPFASLKKDDCWHLCFAAQEYLLSNPSRWTYRFAMEERIFADHFLLLIPEYVRLPEVRSFKLWEASRRMTDLIIQCSSWPTVNIRLDETDTNMMKIMLRGQQLDQWRLEE